MIRALIPSLLSLCLVLTSLGATVAQTRMAAAGGYCGTGAPQILLDPAGMPILDAEGSGVAAPECPACHLTLAVGATAPNSLLPSDVLRSPDTLITQTLLFDAAQTLHRARAPPGVA
jgi:hypothetical protein